MNKKFLKNYSLKLKHILPTYFIVVFGTLIIALAFRWLFSINFSLLIIDEEYYKIWIPIILPWIPITIWLRPKLRILKFKKQNRDSVGHQFIVWLTMAAMLIISNHYLTESTAKFEALPTIENLKEGRYISLEDFQLNKNLFGVERKFDVTGKYGQYFNIDLYFVYPLKTDFELKYWYGKKYHLQISNNLSEQEKEQRFRSFYKTSIKSFKTHNYSEASYYEVLQVSDDKDAFIKAIGSVDSYIPEELIIIEPKRGAYSSDNSRTFAWIFGAFGIGFLIFLFALIFPGYNRLVHQRQLKGIKPKSDELIEMIKFLIPRDYHYITSIIIILNLLVFLIMVFTGINILYPTAIELLEFGGNRRFEVLKGEWWRLFTSMFIHAGFMHIVLNIFGLVLGSIFIEPIFGRIKFLAIYLLSGICASITSIWWHENTVSIGASGAIFGIYGALLGLLLTNAMSSESKKEILHMLGIYVGISLIAGLAGGIDNAAHIGGLISGAMLGLIIYFLDPKAIKERLS
ncbi:MAG: rhomboid family intramembrane serine protease [Flavobacteriaceae bacterium]|nr:rhomboid family intramembrane serine protease [Flavobacteriaceae bacterium]|tara:strand:- start:1821 stop:3365 length:1545 start_codon:yes stop_codon:yes gene_type:complete